MNRSDLFFQLSSSRRLGTRVPTPETGSRRSECLLNRLECASVEDFLGQKRGRLVTCRVLAVPPKSQQRKATIAYTSFSSVTSGNLRSIVASNRQSWKMFIGNIIDDE